MKYKILSAVAKDDTIFTNVEYDIDGKIVVVSVPHFQPENKDEVLQGIVNRVYSEDRKLDCSQVCEAIVGEIELNKDVTI